MFQITNDEWDSLRSQIVTSKNNRSGRRYAPNEIIIALNNLIGQPPKTKKIGFNAGN